MANAVMATNHCSCACPPWATTRVAPTKFSPAGYAIRNRIPSLRASVQNRFTRKQIRSTIESPLNTGAEARPCKRVTNLIQDSDVETEERQPAKIAGEEVECASARKRRVNDASPRMTFLFLIRHGANDWTERGALAGRTPCVSLNETGRAQAQDIAERLNAQPITAIYSSPLLRCIETAQPLATALNLPVRVEPGILEVDYGDWRGGELKELSKRPEWQLVQLFPGGFRFPRGETLREVQSRVIMTLERIRTEHEGEAVAVYAHGDVLRTSLAYYLGTPLDLFQRIQISTASVSLVAFHRLGPRIVGMNDIGGFPVVKWDEQKRKSDNERPDKAAKEPRQKVSV